MRIIISSAGRRVYLVRWFQEALANLDILGEVHVLDYDPGAAAAASADGYRQMPAYTSPDYAEAFWQAIDSIQPNLFISLNDYELTKLSEGLANQLRAGGVAVPALDTASHRAASDKLEMYRVLSDVGIPTPRTVPLSDAAGVFDLLETSPAVIIKDRWGSGSSGLRRLTREHAKRWVNAHGADLLEENPAELDTLVMQPDLGGTEYGVDIVTSVHGGTLEGLMARRKMAMRHGETSAAVTVDNTPFQGMAAALNGVLGVRGTVDIDCIISDDGIPQVIDINPRFGGGYPFSHIAGADVPNFLVASTAGIAPKAGWNTYQHDYLGAKHEGIIGFDQRSHQTQTPQEQFVSSSAQVRQPANELDHA